MVYFLSVLKEAYLEKVGLRELQYCVLRMFNCLLVCFVANARNEVNR